LSQRDLFFFAAINKFEIKAQHLPSEHNRIADHLSRLGLNPIHEQQFKMLNKEYYLQEWKVDESVFNFVNSW
jgi:hypothetical protein